MNLGIGRKERECSTEYNKSREKQDELVLCLKSKEKVPG